MARRSSPTGSRRRRQTPSTQMTSCSRNRRLRQTATITNARSTVGPLTVPNTHAHRNVCASITIASRRKSFNMGVVDQLEYRSQRSPIRTINAVRQAPDQTSYSPGTRGGVPRAEAGESAGGLAVRTFRFGTATRVARSSFLVTGSSRLYRSRGRASKGRTAHGTKRCLCGRFFPLSSARRPCYSSAAGDQAAVRIAFINLRLGGATRDSCLGSETEASWDRPRQARPPGRGHPASSPAGPPGRAPGRGRGPPSSPPPTPASPHPAPPLTQSAGQPVHVSETPHTPFVHPDRSILHATVQDGVPAHPP